jgi:hypothetical protein
MKLDAPANENYAAVIVRVRNILPLPKRDRIFGVPVLGLHAITDGSTQVGDLVVMFGAETQLSLEYAAENNLHRHGNLNVDESKSGYLEDNRRVRAIQFAGNRSDALIMPLSSLAYTGFNVDDLQEGNTFDRLNGHDICNKYVVKTKSGAVKNQDSKERRVDAKFFPLHFDTANYWRNLDAIDDMDRVTVTQKLHGTSIRIGNVPVKRTLKWYERLVSKFVKVQTMEYANVYGSRRVTKDSNNPDQNHFYDTDLWTIEGAKLDGIVPKGYVVYGELIGYTPSGEAIQKNFTYDRPVGQCELYVYRVVQVNPDGIAVDLSWDQVKEFTTNNGLKHVPELWAGLHVGFNVNDFIDVRFRDLGYSNAVPLSDPKLVDEGVCVRVEGLTPRVLKAKSPKFLAHETAMLDNNEVDMEESDGQ